MSDEPQEEESGEDQYSPEEIDEIFLEIIGDEINSDPLVKSPPMLSFFEMRKILFILHRGLGQAEDLYAWSDSLSQLVRIITPTDYDFNLVNGLGTDEVVDLLNQYHVRLVEYMKSLFSPENIDAQIHDALQNEENQQ